MIRRVLFFLLLGFLIAGCGTQLVEGATGTPLSQDPRKPSEYPRVVRVEHGPGRGKILVSVAGGVVYQSTDEGNSFSELSKISFAPGSKWKCCGTLFELPRQVGSLAPGTLLYSATFCDTGSAALDVYTSSDEGKTWAFHSTPVKRGGCRPGKGLWEPEFEVAEDGALVLFWSDETDPCCSQKLAQIRSTDGVAWHEARNTVASNIHGDRPGMAVVTKLPTGSYFMTYELCGPAKCTVFFRTSPDGWNFGPASNTGKKIETASGEYFAHAPTNTWISDRESPGGALLVVGQMVFERNGQVSAKNGKVLFVNKTGEPGGKWFTIPAPIKVPDARDNFCPNYSSVLLPLRDGSALFEVASDRNNLGTCVSYYSREPFGR